MALPAENISSPLKLVGPNLKLQFIYDDYDDSSSSSSSSSSTTTTQTTTSTTTTTTTSTTTTTTSTTITTTTITSTTTLTPTIATVTRFADGALEDGALAEEGGQVHVHVRVAALADGALAGEGGRAVNESNSAEFPEKTQSDEKCICSDQDDMMLSCLTQFILSHVITVGVVIIILIVIIIFVKMIIYVHVSIVKCKDLANL